MVTGKGARPEIAIRVRAIGQLFNSLDPSPFHEKDLDDHAEEFIVGWAQELPPDARFAIVVYVPPEEAAKPEAEGIGPAIAHYFEDRAKIFDREQRELFRIGQRSLAIGLAVLAFCLVASQTLAQLIPNPTLSRVGEESLILLGWVANWRPIEIYLYDWWPIRRRRRLYRRIAAARVIVRAR
jgi:hypothetical protein